MAVKAPGRWGLPGRNQQAHAQGSEQSHPGEPHQPPNSRVSSWRGHEPLRGARSRSRSGEAPVPGLEAYLGRDGADLSQAVGRGYSRAVRVPGGGGRREEAHPRCRKARM